jgi:hypothetical protein
VTEPREQALKDELQSIGVRVCICPGFEKKVAVMHTLDDGKYCLMLGHGLRPDERVSALAVVAEHIWAWDDTRWHVVPARNGDPPWAYISLRPEAYLSVPL